MVLGCYDTSRARVVRTSQQDRQMVLVTAMATNEATDRTGEVEAAAFFTVSRAGDILASRQRNAGPGRSVILDREGHVIFGDMGDDAVRDYFEDRLGRFAPGSLTRRASLAEGGGERDYFFRTRAIPDTDWLVVTFVEESSLGQQFYQVGGILALIIIGLMTLFYFYSRYFLNAIIAPVQEVRHGMERLDQNDLEVQLEPKGQRELQDLMTSFNQMVLSIKNMLRLTEETMEKKHKAEIQAPQSQINPHFIVNTLNSIRFMAQVAKFDGIRKMAEALVSIVSCSFRSNVSFYTVGEELEMLKTYVYLMRIRYSNSFEVSYRVQPGCLDYLLPRLTLQPVLENSITHGFDRILILLARLGERLERYGLTFSRAFPERPDFSALLRGFESKREREIWLRNTLRRVRDACDSQRQERQKGAIQRAREFMQDNFTNPELMLKTVADYVGFSEKYFSSRFTQECGCTFISYLNDLRIGRAQELLLQTDMKIYEVSDAVGYSSVEHFNHMFKKKLCMTPKDFRKSRD